MLLSVMLYSKPLLHTFNNLLNNIICVGKFRKQFVDEDVLASIDTFYLELAIATIYIVEIVATIETIDVAITTIDTIYLVTIAKSTTCI